MNTINADCTEFSYTPDDNQKKVDVPKPLALYIASLKKAITILQEDRDSWRKQYFKAKNIL